MIRVLPLGAGAQSTTAASMSAWGALRKLDGCIFADTGWEPAEVYRHLDWLESVLAEGGIVDVVPARAPAPEHHPAAEHSSHGHTAPRSEATGS